MKKRDVDLKDIEIINILQECAFLSNKDLAKKIRLSEGPTLVRVQNLLSKGVIARYVAIPSYTYLGYKHQLIANVKVLLEKSHAFISRVQAEPQVTQCFLIESNEDHAVAVNEYIVQIYGHDEPDCRQILKNVLSVNEVPLSVYHSAYTIKKIIKDSPLKLSEKDVK